MNNSSRTMEQRGVVMPIGKIGQCPQVVIPKDICDELGLQAGDFVEVRQVKGTVVMKPKKLVDADDVLTPEEEVIVRKGEAQLRRGVYVTLEDVEHDLDRPALTRRRKTTETPSAISRPSSVNGYVRCVTVPF